MKNEICPVGTGLLLRRLGYVLDGSRERWVAGVESVRPDRLGRVVEARVSEICSERFDPTIEMTDDQIRYRRYQAIRIREFGNKFFEGECDG